MNPDGRRCRKPHARRDWRHPGHWCSKTRQGAECWPESLLAPVFRQVHERSLSPPYRHPCKLKNHVVRPCFLALRFFAKNRERLCGNISDKTGLGSYDIHIHGRYLYTRRAGKSNKDDCFTPASVNASQNCDARYGQWRVWECRLFLPRPSQFSEWSWG